VPDWVLGVAASFGTLIESPDCSSDLIIHVAPVENRHEFILFKAMYVLLDLLEAQVTKSHTLWKGTPQK
jgi:hypothetical protein